MLAAKSKSKMAPKTRMMYIHCLIALVIGLVLAIALHPGNGLTQMASGSLL